MSIRIIAHPVFVFPELQLPAGCHELTGMGYLGVDLVIEAAKGPLILELNARPGLNIQLANQCGLRPRLQKVKTAHHKG
jgi:glutathione synthase/RimK-type ligase-like ATP-grasp enzyme